MTTTSKTFGNFIEMGEGKEYLTISFSSTTLPIRDRWLNNSLSANFLADYWGTFFPVHGDSSRHTRTNVRDMVNYIANELLDNAVKFSYKVSISGTPIKIGLYLSHDALRFYVTNSVHHQIARQYQQYIQQLLTEDPDELYIRQVERNAAEKNNTESCLGLLTILHDYQAQLAWKFETARQDPEIVTVTTMVQLAIVRP